MIRQGKYRRILMTILAISLGVSVLSCGPKARKAVSEMDTPSHHTSAGLRLLDQERYADAAGEFDLAIQLDPRYSQAHAGMGLAKAFLGDFAAAFDSMKSAKKYAETKDDKMVVYVDYIRFTR